MNKNQTQQHLTSGSPSDFGEDRLKVSFHDDPRQSSRKLVNLMGCDRLIIVKHLHPMAEGEAVG